MLKSWALICLPAQNVVWPLCQHCLSLAARRVSRNAFPSASDHADGPSIPVPYVAVDIKLFLRPLLLLKPTIRASPYTVRKWCHLGHICGTHTAHKMPTVQQSGFREEHRLEIDHISLGERYQPPRLLLGVIHATGLPCAPPCPNFCLNRKEPLPKYRNLKEEWNSKGNYLTNLMARREMKVFHVSGGGHFIFSIHNIFHSPIHFTYELLCWKSLFSCYLKFI